MLNGWALGFFVFAAAVCGGCRQKSPEELIVGSWVYRQSNDTRHFEEKWTFRPDRTCDYQWVATGNFDGLPAAKMTGSGTYALQKQTMTISNFTVRSQSFRGGQVTRDRIMPPKGSEIFTAIVTEEKLTFIHPEKSGLSNDEYIRTP